MRKTVLITGASSGIGHAFAHVFARHQYNLVLVSRQTKKLLEMKQTLENKYAINVQVISCDLSIFESARTVYTDLFEKSISIDVLVNNAGVGLAGPFSQTSWEKESAMIQLNVVSSVHLIKLLLPSMLKRHSGAILNVASTVGFVPGPLASIYYATKAFLLSFSQALARELKGTGVKVTTLCPGPTDTNFQSNAKMKNIQESLPSAESVAEFGYQALLKGKTVAIHGVSNKFKLALSHLAPRDYITDLIYNFQKTRY